MRIGPGHSKTILFGRPRLSIVSTSPPLLDDVLTLKVAFFRLSIAGKGRLRLLLLELVQYLPVGNVAHLEVLFDHKTLPVANTVDAFRHQGVTSKVVLAHIAVYSFPTLSTVAVFVCPRCPVAAVGQRATDWLGAVLATEAWRADALAIAFAAAGKLVALEVVQITVEARGTAIRTVVAIDGERILQQVGTRLVAERLL